MLVSKLVKVEGSADTIGEPRSARPSGGIILKELLLGKGINCVVGNICIDVDVLAVIEEVELSLLEERALDSCISLTEGAAFGKQLEIRLILVIKLCLSDLLLICIKDHDVGIIL